MKCWICDSERLTKIKPSSLKRDVSSEDFAITNKRYGFTDAIYRCGNCRFMLCPEMSDVLRFYEGLVDTEYEDTRSARAVQERAIVMKALRYRRQGRLLDIGAGSGILVEEALKKG